MTEYYNNEIVYYGKNSLIDKLVSFLGEDNGGFSFEKICPEPEDKGDDWDRSQWRKDHWSTKWECENVQRKRSSNGLTDYLYIKFDCPWNPPHGILDKISEFFPNLNVTQFGSSESDHYKTEISVRHHQRGWSELYFEHLLLVDSVRDGDGSFFGEFKYDGFIHTDVYQIMNEVVGFEKSLSLFSFKNNWLERAEFV